MAQQLINVGTAPDDGTGDRLRTGGSRINANFTETYTAIAAQSARLAALESFTSSGTGAVQRNLMTKLADAVDVRDFGADPTGVADSTSAFVNAFNQSRPVVAQGTYKVTSNVPFTAAGQWLVGYGCRLVPVGGFDVFTVSGALENCGIAGLRVDGAGLTTGHLVLADNAPRFTLTDVSVSSPWSLARVQRSSHVTISNVSATNIRGSYGILWYGDNTTGRSDVLRLTSVSLAGNAGHRPDGIVMNGACNSLHLAQVSLTNVDRGLWVHNSANSGILPAYVMAHGFEVDTASRDCVRLEAGAHFWFSNSRFQGSLAASGIFAGSALTADSVVVTGGRIASNSRYGIENEVRVRVANQFMTANSLGDILTPGSAVLRANRHEIDATGHFSHVGTDPALVFDGNDHLVFARASDRFDFVAASTVLASLSAAMAAFEVPVRLRGYATSGLPAAASNTGTMVRVTDQNHLPAVSNGTAWMTVVTTDYRAPIENFSAGFTVTSADNNKVKNCTATTDLFVSLSFQSAGTTIRFIQSDTGKITFGGSPGVTIRSIGNLMKTSGLNADVTATSLASGTWLLSGALAA
jgi:hypothetical protein